MQVVEYYDREVNENLGIILSFCRHIASDAMAPKFRNHDDFLAQKRKLEKEYIILPLYAYIHSGIALSLHPFSCPWDSGQAGYILVNKDKVKREFGLKKITKKLMSKITSIINDELEEYNNYLN